MTTTDNGFAPTRRLILQGALTVALVGLGNVPFGFAPAFAAANDKYPEDAFKAKGDADAIKSLYGKTADASDKVKLDAPEIAENGAVVPISVSTIGGEALDVINSSGEDVRALSGRVPSLNIESSFGRAFPRFYIRGYGNTDFHLNASQPVSLVYDDVVQENPILKGFPMFDLDRVEVNCDHPLPLQSDGEDLGDVEHAVFEAHRDAVAVLV